MKRLFVILFSIVSMASHADAQGFLRNSELGLGCGLMTYIGDLNNQSMFGTPHFAYGFNFRYRFDDRWSLSVSAAKGAMSGGKPDCIPMRNLDFTSPVYEATVRAEFNFVMFDVVSPSYYWTPFIFVGLGGFYFNPMTQYTDPVEGTVSWVELQPLGTEGQTIRSVESKGKYSRFQIAIPFGMGAKFRLSETIVLTAEYGYRKTWTDYLDDVSTTYVGSDLFPNTADGRLAAELADRTSEVIPGYENAPGDKRGDDSLNDWYAYANVSLSVSMDLLFGWMRKPKCNDKNK